MRFGPNQAHQRNPWGLLSSAVASDPDMNPKRIFRIRKAFILVTKAITNVPIHTTGSAQMKYRAVVDRGNSARLGRFHSTCTSAKTHLEAQQPIISTKLSAMSSVNYVYEITVSIFVKIQLFPSIVLQWKHFSGECFILKQWKRCQSFT